MTEKHMGSAGASKDATDHDRIFELLALLTPWDIDLDKFRIGRRGDGGYVAADQLHPKQAILSYGISNEVSFDLEMAEAGFKVWQFDHTIDGAPVVHDNLIFHKEGVAGRDRPEEKLFTVESHAERFGINLDGAILKMDVEGSEWDVFSTMPETVLAKFDQIYVEFHELARIARPRFAPVFKVVMEKLNRHFTLFHVHANNARPLVQIENYVTPGLLEASFIRTELVDRSASNTWYPTELDEPNMRNRPDLNLWLFPFVPRPSDPLSR